MRKIRGTARKIVRVEIWKGINQYSSNSYRNQQSDHWMLCCFAAILCEEVTQGMGRGKFWRVSGSITDISSANSSLKLILYPLKGYKRYQIIVVGVCTNIRLEDLLLGNASLKISPSLIGCFQ
jgi:hypothetical protein